MGSIILDFLCDVRGAFDKHHKIFGNIGWLLLDNGLRGGLGLILGVWLARYLGPAQFGLLNYALAIAFFFSSVATFGMNNIVVRDVLNSPGKTGVTLGSAFLVQLCGGGLAWLFAVAVAFFVHFDSSNLITMIALLGSLLILRATDVVKFWFESQVCSRYSVWAESGVFLFTAVIKIGLILWNAPLMAFVWVLWSEGVFTALALLLVYSRYGGRLANWQFRKKRCLQLVHDGAPLMIAGLAMAGYMRLDQIMLGLLINEEAVGVFSAALRLSEAWYFIPVSIMASLFPTVLAAKKTGSSVYISRLELTHTLMVVMALALAVPLTFGSNFIIKLLYGSRYHGAGIVLALHIWSALFVFIGVASHQWFVAENMQRFALFRTLCGAAVNMALNFYLIPAYGAVGAAVASLVAHGLVNVALNAVTAETRFVFRLQIRCLLLLPVWNGSIFKQGSRSV